jgi:hypothetical protein
MSAASKQSNPQLAHFSLQDQKKKKKIMETHRAQQFTKKTCTKYYPPEDNATAGLRDGHVSSCSESCAYTPCGW